jgi:hypothetical protein
MSIQTYTSTRTDTFTEASARYVLGKIFDDFNGIMFRGFKTESETIKNWRDDAAFVMMHKDLNHFELQFTVGSKKWAIRYEIDSSGYISRDEESGGIDFYCIPATAHVGIVMNRKKNNATVNEYLKKRGWTSGGDFIAEDGISDRSYSRNGFGVNRKLQGEF